MNKNKKTPMMKQSYSLLLSLYFHKSISNKWNDFVEHVYLHCVFIVGIVFFFSFDALSISANQLSPARSQFDQAISMCRNNQYEQARTKLIDLVSRVQGNNQITSGYLLLATVLEKTGDYRGAEKYLNLLLRSYPYSRYVDHGHFILARLAYKNGEYGHAIDHLLTIIERTKNAELVSLCETIGCKIVASGIEIGELEKISENHESAIAHNWLTYWMIRCRFGLSCRAEAEALAQELITENPDQRFVRLTRELLQRPQTELSYPLRVGIILPLTGYTSSNGSEFLRGVVFALRQQPVKIELFVRDSKGNLNEAIRCMQELLRLNVTLYLGEMESSTSAALAALAATANRPFLVPLATDNNIAILGNSIFQMNNDLEIRSKALAKYAYEKLSLRSFATLAPADEYGQALTDAFTTAIDSLGGTIVAQQWYYYGAQDFKRQFTVIRRSALHFSPRDSFTVAVYQDSLARALREQAPALDFSAKPSGETVENFEVPIRSIDGIFFPIYEEDIATIAPQFALANIEAIPLGGEAWFDADQLRAQRRYIDGMTFFAGKYVAETSMDYIQFKNKYRNTTNSSPGPLAIYGYDVMRVIIAAVEAGNICGNDLVTYLERMKLYVGLGGSYSFSEKNHVNNSVNILQYKDGLLNKVAP